MSKNLTRKGLAFVAMVGLGASSVVAIPAIADTTGPITLEPTMGTTFNSVLQSGITLKSNLSPNDVTVNEAGSLAYVITNPGGKAIEVTFGSNGTLNESLSFTSPNAFSSTNPVTPALNDAARLNGAVTPGTANLATSAKNIYITGSSSVSNGTFASTLQGEVQTVTGLSPLPVGQTARLTLPNGNVLTATNTGSTAMSVQNMVAALVASSEYDSNYATLTYLSSTSFRINFVASVNVAASTFGVTSASFDVQGNTTSETRSHVDPVNASALVSNIVELDNGDTVVLTINSVQLNATMPIGDGQYDAYDIVALLRLDPSYSGAIFTIAATSATQIAINYNAGAVTPSVTYLATDVSLDPDAPHAGNGGTVGSIVPGVVGVTEKQTIVYVNAPGVDDVVALNDSTLVPSGTPEIQYVSDGSNLIQDIVDGIRAAAGYAGLDYTVSVVGGNIELEFKTFGEKDGRNLFISEKSSSFSAFGTVTETINGGSLAGTLSASQYNFGTLIQDTNTLNITTTETSGDVTLTVRAFLDQNGNGIVDAGEKASDVETVVLYGPGNYSATTTMFETTRSATAIKARTVFSNNINAFFVDARTSMRFFKDGTGQILELAAGSGTPVLSTNALEFVGTYAPLTNAVTGSGLYSAQARYTGATTYNVGGVSAVLDLLNGSNAAAHDVETSVTATANVVLDHGVVNVADSVIAARTGTKALTINAVVVDNTDAAVEASNIEVRAVVTRSVLDAGSVVSVTGATGTIASTGVATVTALARTNAAGEVSFELNNTVGKALDNVTVSIEFKDAAGQWQVSDTGTISVLWQDAAMTLFDVTPASAVVAGSTVNVSFSITDQWEQGLDQGPSGRLSVELVAVVAGIERPLTYRNQINTTNGVASFSLTNFAAVGTSEGLRARLIQGTSGVVTAINGVIDVTVFNNRATSSITIAESFTNRVAYVDFVAGDLDVRTVSAAAVKAGLADANRDLTAATNKATITGTVLNVNNQGQPGASVTVSAPGNLLFDPVTNVLATDSINVSANVLGYFEVQVVSHKVNAAGQTVTVTSDGVSKTTSLKTYLPTTISGGNLIFRWNLPATWVMDTTYSVGLSLEDVWENPVETASGDTAVSVAGFGSLFVNGLGNGTLLANQTALGIEKGFNASGETTVFVRSGQGQFGLGHVTATMLAHNYKTGLVSSAGVVEEGTATVTRSANLTGTSWDETLFTPAKTTDTIDVKQAAPAPAGKVNVGSFNGKLVVYAQNLDGARISWKVGGNWGKATAVGNALNRFDRPTPRRGVTVSVQIYVNGVLTLTKSVVTR